MIGVAGSNSLMFFIGINRSSQVPGKRKLLIKQRHESSIESIPIAVALPPIPNVLLADFSGSPSGQIDTQKTNVCAKPPGCDRLAAQSLGNQELALQLQHGPSCHAELRLAWKFHYVEMVRWKRCWSLLLSRCSFAHFTRLFSLDGMR